MTTDERLTATIVAIRYMLVDLKAAAAGNMMELPGRMIALADSADAELSKLQTASPPRAQRKA